MVFTYEGAPGCKFRPSKNKTDIVRHLKRQAWCQCKDAEWTVEKALKVKKMVWSPASSVPLTHAAPVPSVMPPLLHALTIDNRPVVELRVKSGITYFNATSFCQKHGKEIHDFLKTGFCRRLSAHVSQKERVPKDSIIIAEHAGTWMHSRMLQHLELWCERKKKSKEGYAYLVTSDIIDAVKIGSWSGTVKGLRSRYLTAYGPSITVHTAKVSSCLQAEKELHKMFACYNIGLELFRKCGMSEYQEALRKLNEL